MVSTRRRAKVKGEPRGVGALSGETRKSERRALLTALMAPRSAARVDGRYERSIDRELSPVPERDRW